ncbi:hypothetical protein J7L02_03100, partial [Candidatus Woesearchaeota archaeon]|nr:hypothetical protein [Candidatus Woesearchaeota archaeon]
MKKLKDNTVKALERIANAFQRQNITPKTVISRVFFLAVLILALTRLAQILGVLTWILIAVLFIMFFKDLLPQPLTTFFNWVLTIAVVWIIASLVIIPFIPVFFKSAQGQRAWRWVKWSVPNFYYKLQFFVNKTLNPLSWTDEYYTSQVDDASKTLVGLQIRELKVLGVKHQGLGSFNAFYPDQDVHANAIVIIKSVKDFASPVTARFSCWIQKGEEKIMGVTDPESLTTNYWVGGVSCKIPSNALQDLKPGFYSLVFAADFNAYTWAYVNVQFMSEEKAKSLNYQFPTTFITAETTNSPVRIGVYPNDIEQPLIIYKNMADSGSTLTMLGASLNTMHNG